MENRNTSTTKLYREIINEGKRYCNKFSNAYRPSKLMTSSCLIDFEKGVLDELRSSVTFKPDSNAKFSDYGVFKDGVGFADAIIYRDILPTEDLLEKDVNDYTIITLSKNETAVHRALTHPEILSKVLQNAGIDTTGNSPEKNLDLALYIGLQNLDYNVDGGDE